MKTVATWIGIVTGGFVILGAAYTVGDKYGFRPAVVQEVREVEQLAAANSRELLWLQLSHFERIKARRPLTRRECARYLAIAKRLGVPARC